MNKEKFKKTTLQILEPFVLGILALIFIIPTITVMNLTPLTKHIKKLDVLGVTSQEDVVVTMVGGKHEIFTEERLSKIDKLNYSYYAKLNKRASDSYSKPILEIDNKGTSDRIVTLFGQTLSNTRSDIFIIENENVHRIQDTRGDTHTVEIVAPKQEKVILFLAVENISGVQFSEVFDLSINIQEI